MLTIIIFVVLRSNPCVEIRVCLFSIITSIHLSRLRDKISILKYHTLQLAVGHVQDDALNYGLKHVKCWHSSPVAARKFQSFLCTWIIRRHFKDTTLLQK